MKKATRAILWLTRRLCSCEAAVKPYREYGLPEGRIAFSFDDGPNGRAGLTAAILDILKANAIRAYFCVIGKDVEKHPELVRRMRDEGHVIVNHSYSHRNLLRLSTEETLAEIELADRAIGSALGMPDYKSEYFRPPFALVTKPMGEICREYPLRIAGISAFDFFAVDSEFGPDRSRRPVDRIKAEIRESRGGIIVLHDGCHRPSPVAEADFQDPRQAVNRSWVPGALEELIRHFRNEGYSFDFMRI